MKSGYFGIWILLSVALLVILAVSLTDDITIGSYTLKKAPIAEAILSPKSADDSASVAEKDSALVARQKKVEVDSALQRLLIIGDSMTHNLALRLAAYAEANGHEIKAINWDSSSTITWSESDTLDYYIREFHPTMVFISLGANELYLTKPEVRKPNIEKIIEKIGSIPYVWIGPPNWKEDTGFNDMLAATLKPGTFFRSAGMHFDRKADKIHPTHDSSALWMDSVVRWMYHSAHPIVLNLPPDSVKDGNPHISFLKAKHK